MEFRILGPIEVVDGGRTIAIRRGKEQALLAYLLLHPNEVVASDRLVDELWGERPPPTAVKILQNAVSQLRKALGDERLITRPPGYVFRVDPGELDLDRCESLAERGRIEGDAKPLREALGLWRGEPLAELRDEPFARDAALRLEEARLAAQEDRIESDLAEGRGVELVPELEGLLRKHPFDERLCGQLMLALYRAGRPRDALDVYQRARKPSARSWASSRARSSSSCNVESSTRTPILPHRAVRAPVSRPGERGAGAGSQCSWSHSSQRAR